MNYRFDAPDWLGRIPLDDQGEYLSAHDVTGPWQYCQNEHLRRALADEYELGEAIPADVFIMADGEPDRREATKIGGLPFRPATASWPVGPAGTAFSFLAQVNFADSTDIVPALPGDLLLIFVDDPALPGWVSFEWQPLELNTSCLCESLPASLHSNLERTREEQRRYAELLEWCQTRLDYVPPELSPHRRLVSPCYGSMVRTCNYPKARTRNNEGKRPRYAGKEVRNESLIFHHKATQIGTAPYTDRTYSDQYADWLPWRPLCTINSVHLQPDKSFPWLNRAEPLSLFGQEYREHIDKYLMIGDVGSLYVLIDSRNELDWDLFSY